MAAVCPRSSRLRRLDSRAFRARPCPPFANPGLATGNRHCSFEDMRFSIFCALVLRLRMLIHAPFWGCFFGVKMEKNGNFLQFYPSRNAISWNWRLANQTAWKSSRDASKNVGYKKTENHARVIFNPFAGTPPLRQSLWILACGVKSPT